MEFEAMRAARTLTATHNDFLGRILSGSFKDQEVRFKGSVGNGIIRHKTTISYLSESGACSLSSMIAEMLGECGARRRYTQGGQCKECSKKHSAPNFTSSSRNHDRLLALLTESGWRWRWEEDSRDTRELRVRKGSDWLGIQGISKDAALMIAAVYLCSSKQQLRGFRMTYPDLFPE